MPRYLTEHDMNCEDMAVRMVAVENRQAYQHAAVANAPTETTLPTTLISLPVQMPTKAGIEAKFNECFGHINTLYGIARGAGHLAT